MKNERRGRERRFFVSILFFRGRRNNVANYRSSLEGWPRKTRSSVSPRATLKVVILVGSRYFLVTAKQEEVAVAWTSECIGLCLGPTDGIVLHYARRKVQSSTCIPVGMHTEALAPPKPTGINSTNWTWFGSWQTSVPYRSSTFLRTRDSWISRSIAFSPHTIALSSMQTDIPTPFHLLFTNLSLSSEICLFCSDSPRERHELSSSTMIRPKLLKFEVNGTKVFKRRDSIGKMEEDRNSLKRVVNER